MEPFRLDQLIYVPEVYLAFRDYNLTKNNLPIDNNIKNPDRNVHQYDGQLKYTPQKDNKIFSVNKQREIFEKFLLLPNKLGGADNQLVRACFMVQLFIRGNDNWDSSNNIDAGNLLAEILEGEFTFDLFNLLIEQLADNYSLGTCSAGRSTRLLQILEAQREYSQSLQKN